MSFSKIKTSESKNAHLKFTNIHNILHMVINIALLKNKYYRKQKIKALAIDVLQARMEFQKPKINLNISKDIVTKSLYEHDHIKNHLQWTRTKKFGDDIC